MDKYSEKGTPKRNEQDSYDELKVSSVSSDSFEDCKYPEREWPSRASHGQPPSCQEIPHGLRIDIVLIFQRYFAHFIRR